MATAAVSSSSIFQELQSFFQNRQVDLKQLSSALKSGDLAGAQQAYTALAVLGEGGPYANSEPFGKAGRAQAFDAVGEALQAGDLARAQADFATLTAGHNRTTSAVAPAAVVDLASTQTNNASTVDTPPSIYQQLRVYQQQRHADIVQLGEDLQAGDLKAAQQDFNLLTTIGQSGPNRNGLAFQQDNRAQDLQAIGQALQAGDLAGAQSAFASLQGTFGKQNQQAQAAISAYNSGVTEIVINLGAPPTSGTSAPTPTSTSTGSSTPEIIINLGQANSSSVSPSASPEEITINLGSSASGPRVSIEATPGKNGSASDQITIDLNRQNTNNYELILNLLNSGSTSQGQSNSGNALSVSA